MEEAELPLITLDVGLLPMSPGDARERLLLVRCEGFGPEGLAPIAVNHAPAGLQGGLRLVAAEGVRGHPKGAPQRFRQRMLATRKS